MIDKDSTINALSDIREYFIRCIENSHKDSQGYKKFEYYIKETGNAIDILRELRKQYCKPYCQAASHDGAGCLGYCHSSEDDEPIEECMNCSKYTGNVVGDMDEC